MRIALNVKLVIIAAIELATICSGTIACYAEPTTAATTIQQIRTYMQTASSGVSSSILLTVTNSNICNTNNFLIDMSMSGGKEAYATALVAFTTGKSVMLEVSNATGCTGDWTKLQSIYVVN